MLIQTIKQKIMAALPDARVLLEGEDGVHYQAIVISQSFDELSLLKRQQLVNNAIQDLFADGSLHAMGLKTYTPTQWQTIKS